MARIRTVKPEFWTDEKVVECTIPARLLFIGLFNFANDLGCMERSHKRIKMQVFPADLIDCEPLIAELIAHGLLTEYSVNGQEYLYIKGFAKHQKINRPSATKIPAPALLTENSSGNGSQFSDDSVSPQGCLTDGKGREGKGKGSNPSLNVREEEFQVQGDQRQPQPPPTQAPRYLEGVDEPIGKFTMTDDWLPSRDFRRRAAMWGIALPEPDYLPTELAEFAAYWGAEMKVFTQIQWEQKFARHIPVARASNQKTVTARGDENAPVHSGSASRAVQQVRDARARRERDGGSPGGRHGMASVGSHGGNLLEPLDAEEWGGAFEHVDGSDRFND
uniref:Replisome organizer n=1 Tax=Myoviridae sp. ctdyF5 TaxID=2825144 RepID=A0A8S5U7S7_9CAUD|nr:MAG TPA: replisome organizer [Myoviridae sp. ctdyF5]